MANQKAGRPVLLGRMSRIVAIPVCAVVLATACGRSEVETVASQLCEAVDAQAPDYEDAGYFFVVDALPEASWDELRRIEADSRAECPAVWAPYDEALRAQDREMEEREQRDEKQRQDDVRQHYIEVLTEGTVSAAERDALFTVADTYCKHGYGRVRFEVHIIARALHEGLDTHSEFIVETYALREYVPLWRREPGVEAAVAVLAETEAGLSERMHRVRVPDRGGHDIQWQGWTDAAEYYCERLGKVD